MPGSCARHKRDKKIGHRPCPQRAPGAPSMETKIHQFMPRAFAEGLLYAQHGLGSEAFAFSMPVVQMGCPGDGSWGKINTGAAAEKYCGVPRLLRWVLFLTLPFFGPCGSG